MRTIIGCLLALPTASVVMVFSVVGRAGEANTNAGSRSDLQAKIEYCKDCHGRSGQGYVGFLPMPRLAGQTPTYLENQLRAFVERRRDPVLFLNLAKIHGVSPTLRMPLAAHFRDINPRPFGGAPTHLAAAGKKIYEDGVPEANIPACTACHGPEARGEGANPRLAGQLYPYLMTRLSQWRSEHGYEATDVDASVTMARIAHNLNRSQMAAIAAYVSQLK
jgi:cytochrome c553